MYSKYPTSMEIIPRVHSFGCMSLKIGSILTACLLIVYSVLSLAQCTAALASVPWPGIESILEDLKNSAKMWTVLTMLLLVVATIIHLVTLFLTALMLVGALREKSHQMRPWVVWTSIQVTVYFLLFVFLLTMSMVNHMQDNSLLVCLIDFLTLLIRFYMLMIVTSYYRALEDEHSEGERLKTLVSNEVWYNTA